MHTPYEEIRGHVHDFEVKYRIYSFEEGGRRTIPTQGIRWDFWYEHDEHKPSRLYMIYPEFNDSDGNVILEKEVQVPMQGTARMWVGDPTWREYHIPKMHAGMKCYMMEGGTRAAECEVTKIVGLLTNPRSK